MKNRQTSTFHIIVSTFFLRFETAFECISKEENHRFIVILIFLTNSKFLLFPSILHRPQSSRRFSIVLNLITYLGGRQLNHTRYSSVHLFTAIVIQFSMSMLFAFSLIQFQKITPSNPYSQIYPFLFLFSIYKLHSSEKFTFELSSTFNWLDVLVYIFSFFFFFFFMLS